MSKFFDTIKYFIFKILLQPSAREKKMAELIKQKKLSESSKKNKRQYEKSRLNWTET